MNKQKYMFHVCDTQLYINALSLINILQTPTSIHRQFDTHFKLFIHISYETRKEKTNAKHTGISFCWNI